MKKTFHHTLLCLSFSTFAIAAPSQAKEIVLGGTGGALATMQILGDAYTKVKKNESIKVLPSLGSRGGIRAVNAGAIDLGLSSRPLKKNEPTPGTRAIPYADSALVFVTPARTTDKNITTKQVLNIYQGNKRQWRDGTPIRLILRPQSDGDTQYLIKLLSGFNGAYKKALKIPGLPIAYTDQDTIAKIESTEGGFGVTSLSLVYAKQEDLKVFSFNGITPNPRTIADRSYPFIKTFYFIIPSKPTPTSAGFVDFVFSAQGADILEKLGHHPRRRATPL